MSKYIGQNAAAVSLLLLLLVTGCAAPTTAVHRISDSERIVEEKAQQKVAFKAEWDTQMRLNAVGYPILKGASDQCGETIRPRFGFIAPSLQDFPDGRRSLMSEILGVDSRNKVLAVSKNSAAEIAGMKVGDVIVGGYSAIGPKQKESREDAIRRLPVDGKFSLDIIRDGIPISISVSPDLVCDYPITLSNGGEVNAYADGTSIFITRGMVRFAATDRELALVIGHELGHNTMGHMNKKKSNAVAGLALDLLAAAYRVDTNSAFSKAGGKAYSQEFEREADYVGMYYLARAGYSTDGASDFWRRMATEFPANIKANHSASHPATADRFLALEKTSTEVNLKIDAKQSLAPNLK
jgi:hypothetical protein